ncbi:MULTISPECIES: 2-keto-4-pentenoate hydratase [Planococcus]|uniref:Fumarylacetoacetate hydrolase family protein n=1 Tax=Planococcus wigleyi TaxID=2762216 RepID=A0ABR8WG95_9BACL|nr:MULTISPECIES: 2-keto-4-pentenoate hydratase [Planococcus]MBD8016060.1 fumarylacetoacetate hydrolase family protein [Planococcus wigleyi]MDN3438486.1 2-keto-4-pentenoate hydratase [Planococcus sp. APC 3900]
MVVVEQLANELIRAERTKTPIAPFTERFPAISLPDAYQIQLNYVEQKKAQGARVVGKKIGATSKAIQSMFGVNQPDYGHLFDTMMYADGDTVPLESLLQPKVECEIAFVLKKDLVGPNITALDVIEATDYIVPAIEIIDSRIEDWKIRFEDTVSDNGSSALVVMGTKPTKLEGLDLSCLGMNLYQNGKYLESATGAAVLGNPIYAIAWLANALSEYEVSLFAGEIILTGAFTAALSIEDGDTFTAEFAHLGSVSASFSNGGNLK